MPELVNITYRQYCLYLTEPEQLDLAAISSATHQLLQSTLESYLQQLFSQIHQESLKAVYDKPSGD